ncbi:MAG: hemerythrin family protein [Clostridiaceae bacterium]|nr:hemerythrin family protein [Clostridiaceae bacterium]
MVIKWNDKYSCYDETIDLQHKKLIEMINEINEIAELDDGIDRYDEIVKIFEGLKDYAVYHFGYEEKMFAETGYDSFNTKIQQLEHKGFVKKIESINLYDLDENQIGTVKDLLDFLSKWLDHHILVVDLKFGEFLKEKDAGLL